MKFNELVRIIMSFESDTFSAKEVCLTWEEAQLIAEKLLNLLYFEGTTVKVILDGIRATVK